MIRFRTRAPTPTRAPIQEPPPSPGAPFDLDRLTQAPRALNEAAIRSACHAVALPDDVVLCRILGRYKFHGDARDHGLTPHLLLDGFWEIWVTEAVPRLLRPGMTAWDIGANLGYYTLLFADLVGPEGQVHACEPNPRLASLLRRSVALNGLATRVHHHAAPLSGETGRPVRLDVPPGLPQNGHLRPATPGECGTMQPGTMHPGLMHPGLMHTVTLDDLVGDSPADFVKIDAEGAEYPIWRGMQRLVARNAPLTVMLEFTPDRYESPSAFLNELQDAHFALSVIDPEKGILPITAAAILSLAPPNVDRTLVLTR